MKLPKIYEPQVYEADIYRLWERHDAFKPQHRGSKHNYSIVVPPPNANGNLHLGHGLTLAIEDILVRYHRLKGEAALLLPGADHAGFETQVVYEKQLARAGKSRFDFSREELYQQIWDFVAQNRHNYESQFRKLGAGVDWSRYTFTLDQKIVKQAYKTFQKMWQDGLIYRGTRLVNFCTFHSTAFADIEVIYQEDKGQLWQIRYPLTDGSGEVVVATTRPETMLGDTAVAVHPTDKRYQAFVGKTVNLPLTNRQIPILADDMVDPNFGTGAVKITPAHDPNDYEVAQRHDLPMITVITHEGKIIHQAPEPYRGLSVPVSREKIVNDLEQQGYLVKTEAYTHNVGHCYKCGNVIEPLLRDQWFVDVKPLAKQAITALKAGKITFYPDSKRRQLLTYFQNLKDWNISRQIAWGIPIPAFQNAADPEDWIYDERVTEETIEVNGQIYHRDPDVFDTWFSSSSWPYATLDYPEGKDFDQFYPLSVMETAADILFPWVSRMIMLGLYSTGQVPFKAVYLHGLILDEHGQKMSKSKGNVIDPMAKIDQYGSDAFRMGVIQGQTPGSNQPFVEGRVVGARNFCNKLWNIARFMEDKLGNQAELRHAPQPSSAADHWILQQLNHASATVSAHLDNYRLAEAYEVLYHLVWNDVADWYIEVSKDNHNASVLAYVLEATLQLAHPFAPFVTETIWQTLAWEGNSLLATSRWPGTTAVNKQQVADFEELKKIVTEIRGIVSALKISGLTLYYSDAPFVAEHASLIQGLSRLKAVQQVSDGEGLHLTQTKFRCWLDVSHETARAYLDDLRLKQDKQLTVITQLENRLKNPSYVQNAPKHLVEQTTAQLAGAKQLLTNLTAEYDRFAGPTD